MRNARRPTITTRTKWPPWDAASSTSICFNAQTPTSSQSDWRHQAESTSLTSPRRDLQKASIHISWPHHVARRLDVFAPPLVHNLIAGETCNHFVAQRNFNLHLSPAYTSGPQNMKSSSVQPQYARPQRHSKPLVTSKSQNTAKAALLQHIFLSLYNPTLYNFSSCFPG